MKIWAVLLILLTRPFEYIREGWNDVAYRNLSIWVIVTLFIGTVFYSRVENWSWQDALYFSVITLSTVGYGDLTPTQPISRLFTVFYILTGLGILGAYINQVARRRVTKSKERAEQRRQNRRSKEQQDVEPDV